MDEAPAEELLRNQQMLRNYAAASSAAANAPPPPEGFKAEWAATKQSLLPAAFPLKSFPPAELSACAKQMQLGSAGLVRVTFEVKGGVVSSVELPKNKQLPGCARAWEGRTVDVADGWLALWVPLS